MISKLLGLNLFFLAVNKRRRRRFHCCVRGYWDRIQSPNLLTFKATRNRFQVIGSASLGIDSWAPYKVYKYCTCSGL
jgi:hypothetical protein